MQRSSWSCQTCQGQKEKEPEVNDYHYKYHSGLYGKWANLLLHGWLPWALWLLHTFVSTSNPNICCHPENPKQVSGFWCLDLEVSGQKLKARKWQMPWAYRDMQGGEVAPGHFPALRFLPRALGDGHLLWTDFVWRESLKEWWEFVWQNFIPGSALLFKAQICASGYWLSRGSKS